MASNFASEDFLSQSLLSALAVTVSASCRLWYLQNEREDWQWLGATFRNWIDFTYHYKKNLIAIMIRISQIGKFTFSRLFWIHFGKDFQNFVSTIGKTHIWKKMHISKFLSMVDEVPRLTPIRPAMWQAEADTELTLSASPAKAVGQLTLANWRYSSVQ